MGIYISSRISVVIPVKNEAKRIAACIEGILDQTAPVLEIIIIDSGSTDGTLEIISNYPKVRLIEILPKNFNHGETRNLGVSVAKGDLVLFTVGDARPDGNNWISSLLEGFSDESVAGVCGSQVVAKEQDTNPIEWFNPQSKPSIKTFRFKTPGSFESASDQVKMTACSWDNVTAIYRKDILVKIPFRKIIYGEDIYCAMDIYRAGYSLVYNPRARVFHFHLNDYQTTLKRTISVCYLRYKVLGYKTISFSTYSVIIRSLFRLIRLPNLVISNRIYWAIYNFNAVKAQSAGIKLFHQALIGADDALENLHLKYCGTPPIPSKKNRV